MVVIIVYLQTLLFDGAVEVRSRGGTRLPLDTPGCHATGQAAESFCLFK